MLSAVEIVNFALLRIAHPAGLDVQMRLRTVECAGWDADGRPVPTDDADEDEPEGR